MLLAPAPAGGPAKDEDEQTLREIFHTLTTAAEVREFGQQHKVPEALITAADMLRKVDVLASGKAPKRVEEVPVDEKGNKIDIPVEKAKTYAEQADDLFEQAATMGAGVPAIAGLIKAAKKRQYTADAEFAKRALPGGPRQIRNGLQAGGLNTWTFNPIVGRPAAFAIESEHPIRWVINEPGFGNHANAVVRNGNYTFTPRKGVPITVRIQSMGKATSYVMYVN